MAEKDIVSRFGHLLKPIRDLAKNWDVDVASELEEYLLELEEITIAFEGGKANLNFAEAALVIQGSACVYSRKVEYLHALVYQTLELIVNKKRTEVEEQEGEQDITKSNEDQFPLLDDILEARNIDMIEKPFMPDINASIIQRTPMSLLPLHNSEKLLDVPLFNNKGELVGSRSDFKLNTSYINDNGALLLEPIKFTAFHGNCSLPLDSLHLLDNWAEPGGVASDDAVMDLSFHDNTILDAPPTDTINKDVSPPISRRRKSSDKSQRKGKQFGKLKLLDPHKPSKKDKPFKKGSTVLLSKDKTGSRKRKDSDPLPSPSQPLSEFLFQSIYSNSSQFPSSTLERPSTAEFEEQYWSETKRRKSAKKRIEDKVRGTLASQGEEEEEEDHSEGDDRDNEDISPLAALPVEAADQPIPELPDHDFNEVVDHLDDSNPEPPAVVDPAHLPPVIKSYEDLLRTHINHLSSAVASNASDTELSKRVNEWEEKIKPRLNEIEKHRLFDIRYYSKRILSSLQEKDCDGAEAGAGLLPFEKMVEERSQSDICRTFSALLHLANDNKIDIDNHANDDGVVDLDNVGLRLLLSENVPSS